ncbi:hypothetical protein [Arsenophonus nasoniae]|uniref:Uncharacterized protein n=1 Tax=Arsenophonus nasoniae TaxID=638 RepID=A0AA95GKX1_9GAMM|nr:hypothetical protein [Arsenophonus nasoniae]WGM00888.1 hypothetical protein QE210_13680 [Arsenophonus nasoniae]
MNARQRCRERRQMHYRDQCRIRTIRLNLLKKRSTEEIINRVWSEYHTQENDVVNLLVAFKNQLDRHPTDSIDNRCLTKTYLYTVKNRYPRRRRRNGSGNREQHFTNNQKLHTRATRGLR